MIQSVTSSCLPLFLHAAFLCFFLPLENGHEKENLFNFEKGRRRERREGMMPFSQPHCSCLLCPEKTRRGRKERKEWGGSPSLSCLPSFLPAFSFTHTSLLLPPWVMMGLHHLPSPSIPPLVIGGDDLPLLQKHAPRHQEKSHHYQTFAALPLMWGFCWRRREEGEEPAGGGRRREGRRRRMGRRDLWPSNTLPWL